MKIVTYNLRFVYANDGINSFIHRAGLILDTIYEEKPDIICFQETTDKNARFLRRHLSPTYTVLLTQREEGLTGEGLTFFYPMNCIAPAGGDLPAFALPWGHAGLQLPFSPENSEKPPS